MADPKKPYGDVSYADPGYQKDGKKRYPIDTAAHCRAAWSYVNQKKNADEYSSDQLSKIKARIVAACKKFGITVDDDSNTSSSKSVELETEKTVEVETTVVEDAVVADSEVEKTEDPETTKAVAVEDASDGDALVKAVSAFLENADNPLFKSVEAIVAKSSEAIQKSVSDLTERLATVEQMATPGGPQLRRTEIESKTAQKSDLLRQAKYWADKAEIVTDRDLQKGYAATAADFRARAGALDI